MYRRDNPSLHAVIDFETANSYEKGSICSIGIVFLNNLEIVDTYYSLINPQCSFSKRNSEVHGILSKHVEGQPTFSDIWQTVGPMLSGYTIISYNASFDIYALERALFLFGIEAPNLRYACAFTLTKRLMSSDSYALTHLAKALEVEYEAHNALEDALVTTHLLRYLANIHSVDCIDNLMRTAGLAYQYTWFNNYDPSEDSTTRPARFSIPSFPPQPLAHGCSQFFQGKSVVFTGNLTFASRDTAKLAVNEMGGTCKSGVSKKVDIVIVGYYDSNTLTPGCSCGSKLQTALDLKNSGHEIAIIDENDFMSILREGL